MMITTRFGSDVVKVHSIDEDGWARIDIDYHDGKGLKRREIHVSELKADGGLSEVYDAVEKGVQDDR